MKQLRERLARCDAVAYLSFEPDNQTYLAGFRALLYSRPIALLVGRERSVLVVPELELEHARRLADVDEVRSYGERPSTAAPASPLELLDELADPGVLAVDANQLPFATARRLLAHGHELLPFDEMIEELRTVKTPAELDVMRTAGDVVRAGVAAALDACRVGASELELDAAGADAIQRRAAALAPAATIETLVMSPSGRDRSILPHTFSTGRRLRKGDVVIHTRQVALNGYRAELERTVVLGRPSPEQARAFSAMQAAQGAAIAMLGPGVAASSIDGAARDVLESAGYGRFAIHRTGHGIGIGAHEHPHLRFDNHAPLQSGNVVTIEPGIYVPGVGGFRHSDTLLVTDSGSELLTELPRTLDAMTVDA